jgi:hypothetical protein
MTAGLSFVKFGLPDSGTVEVHWDRLQGVSYKRVADYTSDLSPADADNGTWQLFGSQNGPPMLGFIKLQNVENPSGMVEVHWDTLQGGSSKRVVDYTSDFSSADAFNGVWQLIDSRKGAPQLAFIKLQNADSGMVEVHLDAAPTSGTQTLLPTSVRLTPATGCGRWSPLRLGR